MLHDTDKQDEHQVEPASIIQSEDLAPAIHIETSSLVISAEDNRDIPGEDETQEQAPQQAVSLPVSTPVMASHASVRSSRKWAKQAADLPRWEKWKRRLPEVCR